MGGGLHWPVSLPQHVVLGHVCLQGGLHWPVGLPSTCCSWDMFVSRGVSTGQWVFLNMFVAGTCLQDELRCQVLHRAEGTAAWCRWHSDVPGTASQQDNLIFWAEDVVVIVLRLGFLVVLFKVFFSEKLRQGSDCCLVIPGFHSSSALSFPGMPHWEGTHWR